MTRRSSWRSANLRVTPHVAQNDNGGIRVDSDAHTGVTGLFAAGEAAGWQGADQLGGARLSGSQVFGWRAGAKAAKVATDRHNGELQEDSTGAADGSERSLLRGKRKETSWRIEACPPANDVGNATRREGRRITVSRTKLHCGRTRTPGQRCFDLSPSTLLWRLSIETCWTWLK
jgi:succinate dehydrogenase/fumarate reductase flavoprotein subunit